MEQPRVPPPKAFKESKKWSKIPKMILPQSIFDIPWITVYSQFVVIYQNAWLSHFTLLCRVSIWNMNCARWIVQPLIRNMNSLKWLAHQLNLTSTPLIWLVRTQQKYFLNTGKKFYCLKIVRTVCQMSNITIDNSRTVELKEEI